MNEEEMAYFIASAIYQFFMVLLSATGYAFFVRDFLSKRKDACYVGIVYFVVLVLFRLIPWEINNYFVYLSGTFSGFVVMHCLDRCFVRQKLFLTIAFFSIRGLSFDIIGCFHALLYEETVNNPFFMVTAQRQFLVFVSTTILNMVLGMAVFFGFLKLCKRSYRMKDEEMSVREFAMLATPCIAFSIGSLILSYYQFFYEEQMQRLGKKPYDFASFLYYVIALFTIVVVIIQAQKIKEQAEKQKLQEILVQQLHDIYNHTKEAERLYEEIRGLKHDMGNHIQTIKGLLETGAAAEAKQYSSKLIEVYQSSAGEIKTGHVVTDVLLAEKEKTMKQMGISFQNNFHFPVGMKVDVLDISILLNNALDNAIEACDELLMDKSRQSESVVIRLSVCQREHTFLLKMKNSCKKTCPVYMSGGICASTKKEAGHGYGLKNMRMVAEKYMGTLECKQEEGMFSLLVMLQG